MKHLFALVLALCMLFSCAMAETALIENINLEPGFPAVNEPVSVSIAICLNDACINFDPEKNWMTYYFDQVSGLDIEWIPIEHAAKDERISLMLNSGDLPDAVMLFTPFDINYMVQYGMSEEMLYPINELLDYMPNYSAYLEENPNVRAALTLPDGNMYGVPEIGDDIPDAFRFYINTVWLERVGLDQPETLDDFKEILIAFRDQDANGNGDPTDEIPWGGSWSGMWAGRSLIFNAMGLAHLQYGYVAVDHSGEEQEIIYVPYDEKYKEFLLYMNELWNEGLLDPDIFTMTDAQAQTSALDFNVGFMGMSSSQVYDPEHELDWALIHPMTDDANRAPIWPRKNPITAPGAMVINADADEEVAAALASFADKMWGLGVPAARKGAEIGSEYDYFNNGFFYNEETGILDNPVAEDMPSGWSNTVTYRTLYRIPGDHSTQAWFDYAEQHPDSEVAKLYNENYYDPGISGQLQRTYSPYYVDNFPAFIFAPEDLERLNELQIPLDDYVLSMEAKFITGEISIEEEWDNFTATLVEYGVEEYIGIYQEYFAAYNA